MRQVKQCAASRVCCSRVPLGHDRPGRRLSPQMFSALASVRCNGDGRFSGQAAARGCGQWAIAVRNCAARVAACGALAVIIYHWPFYGADAARGVTTYLVSHRHLACCRSHEICDGKRSQAALPLDLSGALFGAGAGCADCLAEGSKARRCGGSSVRLVWRLVLLGLT